MAGYRTRWGTAAALTALAAAALTGCSDDTTPSSVASKAASIASKASDVVASATAEAGRTFDDIKSGVDAKDDVQLGTPSEDADGRTTVEVTATNTAASGKSFAVQVDFTDGNGKLVDAVVVTVSDVPAGGSGKATARSTHGLSGSGEVKTKVSRAIRY